MEGKMHRESLLCCKTEKQKEVKRTVAFIHQWKRLGLRRGRQHGSIHRECNRCVLQGL